MKLTTLLMILLSIFEFAGCAGAPPRPDVDFCAINFASDKPAHLHCFNVLNDYADDGALKPDAKAHDKPITSPQMLNAGKYMSKEDWPAFEAWLQSTRDWAKGHCQ